jgi:PIN domain nuclease of toxin-antitoxin system
MKLLLDTHAFLWAISGDPRLSEKAEQLFVTGRNELYFSVASVWEVLTKVQIGKLPLPSPVGPYLSDQLARNSVYVLPVQLEHVLRLETLPLHHRDPFDRILVAQSLHEDFPILTADPLLKKYSASLIW